MLRVFRSLFGFEFGIILILVTAIHFWYWIAAYFCLPAAYPIGYKPVSFQTGLTKTLFSCISMILEFFWHSRWRIIRDPFLGTIQTIIVQSILCSIIVQLTIRIVPIVFRHQEK